MSLKQELKEKIKNAIDICGIEAVDDRYDEFLLYKMPDKLHQDHCVEDDGTIEFETPNGPVELTAGGYREFTEWCAR